MESREADIIDYLEILWRWKGLVTLGVAVCILATGVVTWLLPRTYRLGAVVEIGELSEDRAKDTERLVARLTADGFRSADQAAPDGRLGLLTIEYKKPYRLELSVDTTIPEQAVRRLEAITTRLVEDLNRLAGAQRADEQAAMEALRQEVALALAQIQGDLGRRIEAVKRGIESTAREGSLILLRIRAQLGSALAVTRSEVRRAAAEIGELEREHGIEEGRLGEIQTQLAALQRARGELHDGGRDLPQALLFSQLSREILEREDVAAQIRASLATLPARLEEAKARRQATRARLDSIEAAHALVQDRKILERPKDLEAVWVAVWQLQPRDGPENERSGWREQSALRLTHEIPTRLKTLGEESRLMEAALSAVRRWDGAAGGDLGKVREVIFQLMTPGSGDAATLERAVRRIEIEIPERLRALKRQMERGDQGTREARVVVAPRAPGAPMRPRVMLNLAAGAIGGLVGSVLLAFVAEYVSQARQRRPE